MWVNPLRILFSPIYWFSTYALTRFPPNITWVLVGQHKHGKKMVCQEGIEPPMFLKDKVTACRPTTNRSLWHIKRMRRCFATLNYSEVLSLHQQNSNPPPRIKINRGRSAIKLHAHQSAVVLESNQVFPTLCKRKGVCCHYTTTCLRQSAGIEPASLPDLYRICYIKHTLCSIYATLWKETHGSIIFRVYGES